MEKPLDTSSSDNPQVPEKKDIKTSKLIYMGLGGTIGGSIYVILGNAIEVAGAGILISLLLLGILLIFIIMSYSELSLSLPILGGGYSFSKEAIGGFWGFLIGWVMWLGNITFAAVSGLSFAYSLSVFFPDRAGIEANYIALIGFIIVLVYTLMNIWFKEFLNKLMSIFTFILIAGFIAYIVLGLLFGSLFNAENYTPSNLVFQIKPLTVIQVSPLLVGIFCIYEWNSSYESIASKMEEIKQPKKRIPKAFMYSMIIGILIYFFVGITTLINMGTPSGQTWMSITNSENPLADTFFNIAGIPGLLIMALAGMICTMTSLQASILMSTRIFYAMARDGYFPKIFTRQLKTTKQKETSGPSLLISCLLIVIFTLFFDVDSLVSISNLIILITLTLISFLVIILRQQRPKLVRPYKIKWYPQIPIIGGVITLLLLIPFAPESLILAVIMLLLGITIYALNIARRDRVLLLISGSKIGAGILTLIFLILTHGFNNAIGIILCIICGIAFFTVYFDLRPISLIFKDMAQKKDGSALVVSEIVEIDEEQKIIAHRANIVIGVILIIGSIFFFIAAWLGLNGQILFLVSGVIIDQNTVGRLGGIIFIINGICLLIGGLVNIALQVELQKIKM